MKQYMKHWVKSLTLHLIERKNHDGMKPYRRESKLKKLPTINGSPYSFLKIEKPIELEVKKRNDLLIN
nr:unnamed protein product [Callosobruchus analis]